MLNLLPQIFGTLVVLELIYFLLQEFCIHFKFLVRVCHFLHQFVDVLLVGFADLPHFPQVILDLFCPLLEVDQSIEGIELLRRFEILCHNRLLELQVCKLELALQLAKPRHQRLPSLLTLARTQRRQLQSAKAITAIAGMCLIASGVRSGSPVIACRIGCMVEMTAVVIVLRRPTSNLTLLEQFKTGRSDRPVEYLFLVLAVGLLLAHRHRQRFKLIMVRFSVQTGSKRSPCNIMEIESTKSKVVQKCLACQDALTVPVMLSCCGKACCEGCWRLVIATSKNTCPYCEAANPEAKLTGESRILNCPRQHCGQELTQGEYLSHGLLCQQIPVRCSFCKVFMSSGKYVEHCQEKHADELLLLLAETLPSIDTNLHQLGAVYELGAITINLQPSHTNDRGFISKFGTTGKLYCGQPLEVGGCGCDGYCGPNNGCNCMSCMRLNLKIRGASGARCLINNCGDLCKISENGSPYCGIRLSRNTDRYCRPEEACGNCANLVRHNMMNKYSSLL